MLTIFLATIYSITISSSQATYSITISSTQATMSNKSACLSVPLRAFASNHSLPTPAPLQRLQHPHHPTELNPAKVASWIPVALTVVALPVVLLAFYGRWRGWGAWWYIRRCTKPPQGAPFDLDDNGDDDIHPWSMKMEDVRRLCTNSESEES